MAKKKINLIGYCGMYCGDCPAYTQKMADLARDLRAEFRLYRIGRMAD